MNADYIKLAVIKAYEEVFQASKVTGLAKLLNQTKSKTSVFAANQAFAKRIKELIPEFNEQIVAIVLDIVLRSNPVNKFELIRKYQQNHNDLANLLLEQVESKDALCLKHLERASVEKEDLWLYVRDLFAYPMYTSVATAQLNLYLVQKGLEETAEDWTTSSIHVYEDGYTDDVKYVITKQDVQFIHESMIEGAESISGPTLSHDDFQTIVMELYRTQILNYSLSKEVRYMS